MTNQILGAEVRGILAEIYEIQTSNMHYDNVGVSIDFIDGDWMYGITVGGVLERDFGTIEGLAEGLKEFRAEIISGEGLGSTPSRTVIDSQSI